MNLIFIIHVFSCYFMTGAIWLVQVLVYPNFKILGKSEFQKFHDFHMKRITWIVAPIMAIELITGSLLFYQNQNIVYFVNLVSIFTLWGLTVFINVPSHKKLKFELEQSKNILVNRNWPRTFIWTVRSLFLTWILFKT